MCGILGIVNLQNKYINDSLFKTSAMLMHHRGPNAYGQWGIDNKILIGHLRLSIVDLKPESNQPFFSNCKRYVVVFNGEIYNYIELREQLLVLGYTFSTESDTEVLLNSYIEWGENCVTYFNGDWAFALYDTEIDKLFCSRDRFGVKPFNYAFVNESFIFSSEIKSIINYFPDQKIPNNNVILNYIKNSLGAQIENTWFENIKRLMPAHNFIFEKGKFKIYKYWEYPKHTNLNIPFTSAVSQYKELFIDAVNIRLRSDVEIGITLSSGIDSSSITAVVNNLGYKCKTFTADFQKKSFLENENIGYKKELDVNEFDLVKKYTKSINFESNGIQINNDQFVTTLRKVIFHLESGHSSHATIPILQVMEKASKEVTVLLEGQGADELLAGYVIRYYPWLIIYHLKNLNIRKAYIEFKNLSNNYSIKYVILLFIRMLNSKHLEYFYQRLNGINKVFSKEVKSYTRLNEYPENPNNFSEKLNEELFKSHTGGLVNLLHYGDAISMSNSLESRNPFTDFRLVEYVFKLPLTFKLNDGFGKYIHRKSMDGLLPNYILDNKLKLGFNSPLSTYFISYDSEVIKILLSKKFMSRNLFDPDGIKFLIKKNIRKKGKYSSFLFRILSVELWFQEFID